MQNQLCPKKDKSGSIKIEKEVINMIISHTEQQLKDNPNLNEIEGAVTQVLQKIRQVVTTEMIVSQDQKECDCHCGKKMNIKDKPSRTVIGLVPYTFKRRLFYCSKCKRYERPLDRKMGLAHHERYTLEIKQAMVLLGQRMPFEEASDYLAKLMKVEISDQSILTLVEAVGKQIARDEKKIAAQKVDGEGQIKHWQPSSDTKKGAAYLQMDGSMVHTRNDGWKEVRNGLLFQAKDLIRTDKHHRQIFKKRYFSVFNNRKSSLQQFRQRSTQEAYDFGFHNFEHPVILADGAKSIWDYADQYHPYALQILDYYHASEYLGLAFNSLKFEDTKQKTQIKKQWFDCLWDGKISTLISQLLDQKDTKEIRDCIRYYKNNQSRMKYKYYRNLGLEIGSGAIESAHRIIVQCRMKQSGMHWKKANVQSIVSLRAKYLSGHWPEIVDDYLLAA